jgi:ABC-type transporter Mla MlaB component
MMSNQLQQKGAHLTVSGPLTLDTVPELYTALDTLDPPIERVDLASVTEVDSAALAWLVSLCRLAPKGAPLFENPPANLLTLAQLYELTFLRFGPTELKHKS